jgi:hypothetical protein
VSAAVRLLRLTARCPSCGAPPKLRTFPSSAAMLGECDPDEVFLTYECHIRRCATVYDILIRDFHEAA